MQASTTPLPQLGGGIFLSDSGMETTLVFQDGIDLPAFAAFPVMDTETGRDWFNRYYDRHLALAERHGTGFIIDTPTWRANPDWGATLGRDSASLRAINIEATKFCQSVRERWAGRVAPILVCGVIGPRGDGYKAGKQSAEEAEAYHAAQITAFTDAGVDMVAAYTLSTADEAIGIARAANKAGIPCAISFTVETDGRLASGMPLGAAIEAVDAATGRAPAYFMINCAHPSHFASLFDDSPAWAGRILGLKANASTMSHAELDEMTELDDGDPDDLGQRYAALRGMLPKLSVLGGCCGTDHRHVAAIAGACCNTVRLERRDI